MTHASTPRLAAIVLNYGTPVATLAAVHALLQSHRCIDDLIVVDNHDSTACATVLEPVSDRLRYVRTGCNLGFAGGMNVGIRIALDHGADLVLLVNSDATVPPATVAALERALTAPAVVASASAPGIAGPLLLAHLTPDVMTSAGIRFNVRSGRMRHHAAGARVDAVADPSDRVVDAVSGCVMLVRAQVFTAIGELDEPYFFGFEDIDFCLRARQAGFASVIVRSAVALHEGSRSIGPTSDRRLYFAARNHLRLATRAAPAGQAATLLRAMLITSYTAAYAVRTTGGSVTGRLLAVLRGVRDHVAGDYGAPS